eukprot:symbB.v1.2.018169.t1/scaffold1438.1/size118802/4
MAPMAPIGKLLSGWASSFDDLGKGEAMPMKQPEPVGDSLPLDIHVIIKKASGGIGGMQVTKPSTTGGLTPESAGVVAGAPAPKVSAMCLVLLARSRGPRQKPEIAFSVPLIAGPAMSAPTNA